MVLDVIVGNALLQQTLAQIPVEIGGKNDGRDVLRDHGIKDFTIRGARQVKVDDRHIKCLPALHDLPKDVGIGALGDLAGKIGLELVAHDRGERTGVLDDQYSPLLGPLALN